MKKEDARALSIERRVREGQVLAPVAHDAPDLAQAPLRDLWPSRRALLIVNTKSGPNHDSILRVRELVAVLASFGIRSDVRIKLRKSQARKQARAAAKKPRKYDFVIAAGGDGTVEAVARGLVGTDAILGIVPLGTYNNVASCLGVPNDVQQACALIAIGRPRRIDVGMLQARYMKKPRLFMEVSTVGLGAVLAPLGQNVEKGRWEQAVAQLPVATEMAPTPMQADIDGVSVVANSLLVTVSNTPRAGAGLVLAPDAHVDDGMLDVTVYRDMDRPALLAAFLPTALGRPAGQGDSRIQHHRARSVTVRAAHPMPVSIETKLVGVTPARFTVVPGGLRAVTGDGAALLDRPSPLVLQASIVAAKNLPQNEAATGSQAKAGLPGRAASQSLARLAVPMLSAAVGLAAISLVRPVVKRLFR